MKRGRKKRYPLRLTIGLTDEQNRWLRTFGNRRMSDVIRETLQDRMKREADAVERHLRRQTGDADGNEGDV